MSRIGRLAGTESRQERKADEVAVALPAAGAWVVSPSLWAWSNHTVGSYLALRELAAIREAPEVEVEPLEAFSPPSAADWPPCWTSRKPTPERISATTRRVRTPCASLPRARPATCVRRSRAQGQPGDPPGAGAPAASRAGPAAPAPQATGGAGVPEPLAVDRLAFHPPGARRASRALAVLATAADEPDYGHDINLFSDNPGEAGQRYGFGTQPFGDPRFEFSSQAPFHMGFYHEAAVIYSGARSSPGPGRNGVPTSTSACPASPSPTVILLGYRFWLGHALHPGTSPSPTTPRRCPVPAWRRCCRWRARHCSATRRKSRRPSRCREPPYRGGVYQRLAAPTAPRRPPAADARRLRRHPPRRCLSGLFADLLARRGGRRVERPRRGLRRRHRRMAGCPPGLRRAGLQREQPATPPRPTTRC